MAKAKENDDRIPWQQWQRHDEAAEAYHRTMATGQGGNGHRGTRDTNVIRVKNESGSARSLGHILEFTGLELSNLDGDVPMLWMTGGSPTLANGFGVLLQPLDDDESGPCQIAGACKALVNVTNTSHVFATVNAATYVLQSAFLGPIRILYKPSGTGEKKCAVLLGQAHALDQSFVGKPAANKTKGATDLEVTLYNKYQGSALGGSVTGCIALVRDLTTADWVSGTVINGFGHVAPLDCE